MQIVDYINFITPKQYSKQDEEVFAKLTEICKPYNMQFKWPQRTTMENLIKAFQIFLKYGNPEYPTHCEHDVMYVSIEYDIVSDADKKALDELGFIHCEDNDIFKSYMYGSA